MIQEDTLLQLYDYPLDHEIEQEGDVYHDPDLPKDQITWQYTVVKPDYKFPDIRYEILSELFIPQNSKGYTVTENDESDMQAEAFNGESTFSKSYGLDRLETVSLYLTDNLPEKEKTAIEEAKSGLLCWWIFCWDQPDPWYPSGTVRIQDTELGWQPVGGVKIRAQRWFYIRTTTTNSRGEFRTGYFKRNVRYRLIWETYEFSIREAGWLFGRQARIRGSWVRNQPWHVRLAKHSKDWFNGTIFQAAYHYYYKDIKGLKRPPTNSFWKPQMKIRARFEQNRSVDGTHCKDCRYFGILARIKIFNPHRKSSQIYSTTIHELAHASHWELRKWNWWNRSWNQGTATKVKESWARGVEWELTRMKYPAYKAIYFKEYTGIVQDMIDGIDGYDKVSGYTIRQIEDVLSYTSSWEDWKNNIKNRYNNATENHLDALFTYW